MAEFMRIPRNRVMGVSVAPGGEVFVTASDDHTSRVVDLTRKMPERVFSVHSGPVRGCALVEEGEVRLITVSADGSICAFNHDWELSYRIEKAHRGRVFGCRVADGADRFYTIGEDGFLRSWELFGKNRLLAECSGHRGRLGALALSETSGFVVTGAEDHTLRVWDLGLSPVTVLSEHKGRVQGCAFSPDGQLLASVSSDRTVKLWSANSGWDHQELDSNESQIRACAFSPEGHFLVLGTKAGKLHAYNVGSRELIVSRDAHAEPIRAVATYTQPDGVDCVLSASADGTVCRWSLPTLERLYDHYVHSGPKLRLSHSLETSTAVAVQGTSSLFQYDTASGQRIHTMEVGTKKLASCVSLSSSVLCTSITGDALLVDKDGSWAVLAPGDGIPAHAVSVLGSREALLTYEDGRVFLIDSNAMVAPYFKADFQDRLTAVAASMLRNQRHCVLGWHSGSLTWIVNGRIQSHCQVVEGPIWGVALHEDDPLRWFLATQAGRLLLGNAKDETAIELWSTNAPIYGVAALQDGKHAVIATKDQRLNVIATRRSPALVGSLILSGTIHELAACADHAVLGIGDYGLYGFIVE